MKIIARRRIKKFSKVARVRGAPFTKPQKDTLRQKGREGRGGVTRKENQAHVLVGGEGGMGVAMTKTHCIKVNSSVRDHVPKKEKIKAPLTRATCGEAEGKEKRKQMKSHCKQ